MASTFRSHFRRSSHHEDPLTTLPRSLPAKSFEAEQQKKQVQPGSKLKKKASRVLTTTDKPERGVKNTARAPTAVAAGLGHALASNRSSVTPHRDTIASGAPTHSSFRHNGLPPPPMMRTPSLVSGSSVSSTFDSPRSNGLRRKPSTIDKYAAQKKADSSGTSLDRATSHRENDDYPEEYDDSILGISFGYATTGPLASADIRALSPQPANEREWHATRTSSPIPHYALSTTSSARYTDSPFSHAPTSSSVSSYSSAVVPTSRPSSRPNVKSPGRSQTADSTRPALQPVRESSTSSSTSTVKSSVQKKDLSRKTPTVPPVNRPPLATRSSSRGKSSRSLSMQTQKAVETGISEGKPVAQNPPELAHLNVEVPSKKSVSNKPLPPVRPSRDGTPNLATTSRPSPVVQSDLPAIYSTYHKRTPSQETPPSPTMRSRFGIPSKSPSKHASPRVDSAISPPPSARNFTRGPTPELPAPEQRRLLRKDSPVVGPPPSPSKSYRFGLFSRKSKSDVPKPAENIKREARKGPAAGTGHEGYGRFGVRGRSGSTTSSADVRSSSIDSNASSAPPTRPTNSRKTSASSRKNSLASAKSSAELDDFLKERLNPVILRGSGSTFSKTPSSVDLPGGSLPASSNNSSFEGFPKPQLLPSAMQHSRGVSPLKRPPLGQRLQSDSSDDDFAARYPSLATRRSLTRLSQTHSQSPVRLLAPIITNLPTKQSSIDSYDAEGSAWPQTDSSMPLNEEPIEGKEGLWLRSQHSDVVARPTRKWNFFQRAQSSPRAKGKQRATDAVHEEPPSPLLEPDYRGVAHYNLLDPISPVSLEEVEAIVHENDLSNEDSLSDTHLPPKMVPYERRHTSLLPSPPQVENSMYADFLARRERPPIIVRQDSKGSPELLRAQEALPRQTANVVEIQRSPVIADTSDSTPFVSQERPGINPPNTTPELEPPRYTTPDGTDANDSPRQPRLSPVGRIPRVVSKRDRDRKLPDNSFSRPFARSQPNPSVKPPGALYNQIRELASPIESSSQPISSTSTRSDVASADPQGNLHATHVSNASTARTSMDFHASEAFFAITPPRKDSTVSYSSSSGSWVHALAMQPPQVDDPWNEFDDLLDDMLPRRSAIGSTYHNSNMPNRLSSSVPKPLAFGYQRPPPTSRLPSPPGNVLSVPQQIARFMQPSMSPLATPHSISDFVDRYGHRSTSTLFSEHSRNSLQHGRGSFSQGQRMSTASARGSSCSRNSRVSVHSRSASLPEGDVWYARSSVPVNTRSNRDAQLLGIAEDDIDETASRANLRFGALMTSKWLSFGRVLFSPAHNEMRLAGEPRVLVLDGLGSDWSYYVALSYPSASVYSLGPAPAKGSTQWPGINQKPPPNHKHYPHEAINAAFPFPKGFFTAVVFRFPIATTEEAYHACMCECKRVLRPGGYLEVAVLDLDLMNMGNKARKAVRDLKTRMQFNDQTVSLRNMSDILVRHIGRRGFEDVQRCIVGVPAAGRIPRSEDVSSDSSDVRRLRKTSSADASDPEINFADLLQDSRNSQYDPSKSNNDEGITKMVARVGRWWYSTCYEMPLPKNDSSIWDDPNLLRECEKQGTSFKLLICHAQKPAQTRRRTVSV